MTQRNLKGKLVCPIYDCRKQYVDEAQLGKHLLKDHPKDISLREKKTIKRITSLLIERDCELRFLTGTEENYDLNNQIFSF